MFDAGGLGKVLYWAVFRWTLVFMKALQYLYTLGRTEAGVMFQNT